MTKQTIEVPIEWIDGLKNYIENVKKTANSKDIYLYQSHKFAVTALLDYLGHLQSEVFKKNNKKI